MEESSCTIQGLPIRGTLKTFYHVMYWLLDLSRIRVGQNKIAFSVSIGLRGLSRAG